MSGVYDGQTAIAFSSNCVVVQGLGGLSSVNGCRQMGYILLYLLKPLQRLFGKLVLLAVLFQVFYQLREDRLKLFQRGRHLFRAVKIGDSKGCEPGWMLRGREKGQELDLRPASWLVRRALQGRGRGDERWVRCLRNSFVGGVEC